MTSDQAIPRYAVVGVGASAGGIVALQALFQALPAHPGLAFIVVLHLPSDAPSRLVDLIASWTPMSVQTAKAGVRPERNHVYVAAPGDLLMLEQGAFRTRPREGAQMHPGVDTIDVFFESLATNCGPEAIAVILSGTGTDGAAGALRIRQEGGLVIVQDPATALFDGMPLAAISSTAADRVLPLEGIAAALAACAGHSYDRPLLAASWTDCVAPTLDAILDLIRKQAGFDLRGYKTAPLLWRIHQRMELRRVLSVQDYEALLKDDPAELEALARDISIQVTGFFRDPEAWDTLERDALAPLLAAQMKDRPVRAWTAACCTGEEAYSLAMLLSEHAADDPFDFQIFATDASPHLVARASQGIFSAKAVAAVSPARRARHFYAADGQYRVNKSLRRKMVFATQDLLADPPLFDLDLVTCRNLLIYLNPAAAKRAVSLLNSALRMGGYLFLGKGEAISPQQQQSGFEVVSHLGSIYRKIGPCADMKIDFPKRPARIRHSSAIAATSAGAPLDDSDDAARPAELSHDDVFGWSEAVRLSHEELDASREELLALNEELKAANDQLNLTNEDLSQSNARLREKIAELKMQSAVLSSGEVMTLFLDDALRVRWFTPATVALFPLRPPDVGRKITDFTQKFSDDTFIDDVQAVLRAPALAEAVVQNQAGRWFIRRIRPYLDGGAAGKGVAITFADISERKRMESELRRSEERFRALVTASSYAVYRMSPDWTEMRELDGRGFIADLKNPSRNWIDVYIHPEDQPAILEKIAAAVAAKGMFECEHRVRRADGSLGWTLSRAVPILDDSGDIVEWFGAASDITALRSASEWRPNKQDR